MNLILRVFQVFLLAVFAFHSTAFADSLNYPISSTEASQKIETLIQQKMPNSNVGIFVQDAKTGNVLYERRAAENFLPGSTTKLLTAAAALIGLGTDYTFETSIKIDPDSLKSGTLTGDVFMQFTGDPSLRIQDLQALIKQMKSAGITQIVGDVVIDNTRFQGPNYALGWSWNSLPWGFAPPITTIILNENKAMLNITPSKTLGEKATLAMAEDEPIRLNITHDVVSVSESDAKEKCQIMMDINSQNEVTAYGCWPAKESSDSLKIAIQNPTILARQVIADALKAEQIKLTGQIALGTPSKELKTIASHRSKPLSDLMKTVLQDSNNIYTESLIKTLGVQFFKQGNFHAGVAATKDILAKHLGLDTSNIRLQDGSGLSRYTAISPQHFGRILYGMYNSKQYSKVFRESLSISGEAGTLKNRMTSFDLSGQVFAKTGTMLGTSSLAGYLNARNKQDVIFVIMINNATAEKEELRNFENALCEIFTSI